MKKLIGYCGVDSGQLMICDPCYIASEWKDVPFKVMELYAHKKLNKIFGFNQNKLGPLKIESFKTYEKKTSTKKSMNEMIANKEVKKLDIPDKNKLIGTFSYGGVCETTMKDKHQINFKLGHTGCAVAFCTGYGDGYYPVYGTFNKEGRCMKVEINFN